MYYQNLLKLQNRRYPRVWRRGGGLHERDILLHSLGKLPLISSDMETEAVVWRLAEFVQLCNTRTELHRIWHIVRHLNIFAQKEVCLRRRHLEFTPSIWLRHE